MTRSKLSYLAVAMIEALKPFVNDELSGFNLGRNDEETQEANQQLHDEKFLGNTELNDVETPKADENTVWALASCKEFYIPHNEVIHASSKRVTADGTFAKFRGLDKDKFIKAEGALVDSQGLEAELYELDDNQQPVLILGDCGEHDEIVENVENEKPTKPAKKTPPTKPSKPAKKTPPAKADKVVKQEAIKLINQLVKAGIDYDFIIKSLLEIHGVSEFSDLPEAQEAAVHRDAKAWITWLDMLDKIKADLQSFDDEYGDELVEEFNGLAGDLKTKYLSGLSAAHTQVKELYDNWSAFYTDEEA